MPDISSHHRLLAVATEWFPAHGGLSTLNQHLCTALAARGDQVFCLVPTMSEAEHAAAAAVGVELIAARRTPGYSGRNILMRRPSLPGEVIPTVVLGHGHVTGPEAKVLCEDTFPSAVHVHVMHVAPNEVTHLRPQPEGSRDAASVRADERTRLETELAATADLAVAIGPRLHRLALRDLGRIAGAPTPVRLDPGFDIAAEHYSHPPLGGPIQVLVSGRMGDATVKGVDLAARALAFALDLRGRSDQELELVVRGAPAGDCDSLRRRLVAMVANPALHITVLPYTTAIAERRQDLARAMLSVMPSRADGFGLSGLETITAGVPTLVSDRSGLGELITDLVDGDLAAQTVVPVTLDDRDAMRWGHEIAAILRNPTAAYASADDLRRRLAAARSWRRAAHELHLDLLKTRRGGPRPDIRPLHLPPDPRPAQ
ncbi:hypothetical protein C5E51_10910 [Nocardia nova]|uniref:glycosyltransferase n=1 Tax=Nocardia nova TaxID=37330 RepID=UPI000CEA1910|nr:glycosyltransferase [Nocardia nova]PPJ10757.1 hypothetical protein C5E51_10910 [Nocardia nova]